jgi:hypothetical protein
MKKWMFSLVAIPALLFGCGEEEPIVDTLDSGVMPVAIEVEITSPTVLHAGESVELSARVTQGAEVVNDAEEVKFEVWESGLRDAGIMLEGELTEDGTYAVDYTFAHDGVYFMYAHTTARGLHVMPKQEIIVGNPDMSQVLEDTASSSMDHGEMDMNVEEQQKEHGKEGHGF